MSRKTIGLSFYVNFPTQIRKSPVVKNIANSFDYIGGLVSLQRLSGESNVEFKNRLWDVNVHLGGPDYEGILNNIGRELGFLRRKALTIELKTKSNGEPVAINPRVDFLANRVVLYSDWRPNGTAVIDREINFYKLSDSGYYLSQLVTEINSSPYFTSTIEDGTRSNLHSFLLIRSTSDRLVVDDRIRVDKFQELEKTNITNDSLSFVEKGIFETEVNTAPAESGEYFVDYLNGTVESFDLPSGVGACSYHYAKFPMEIDCLPIQIFSFQDEDFQKELFDQKTLESGDIVNALPNIEGTEIYHQLYMETNVFWGN